MTDDHLQSLRRLMKRYRIRFQLPGEEWPALHADTFNNIKTLGSYSFDTYSAGVSIWSSNEPWKQQIKSRAEWLNQRAQRLFSQERNEAGWRFELENDVLMRFSVEVACPKCRARIWQSEIQATLTNHQTGHAEELDRRRKQRKSCECPPDERIRDFYELGTNRLFDSRAQEFVVYDELVRSQLPKQAPDRVVGLQNTKNFDTLLSSPVRPDLARDEDDTVSDILQVTPFKSQSDPLLFPFLLLEAKSETSASGFDAIQVQSAFPIYALLQLQEGLRSCVDWSSGEEGFEPLVWFLAFRGDAWRVYASHLVRGADGKPTQYAVTLLWSGSLMHKDNALQLLLIVDYIMDWARDIYRTAILKQLKSLVTGQAFDQVSVIDSEIFSMRRKISDWIPGPPSTAFEEEDRESGYPVEKWSSKSSLDHQTMLKIQIPNSGLGTVRSALLTEDRFDCFYLTESLVPSFLEVIGGRRNNPSNTEKAARHIINFVIQFEDVLVMNGTDLGLLEVLWTGTSHSVLEEEEEEDFYVLLECSWYITPSWEITRQLSCFAISKGAFRALKTYANFAVRRKGIETLDQAERRCPRRVLQQCVECLRAGSPWQVLLAAISNTSATIYPLPVRRREDFAPPIDTLGLVYTRNDHARAFIMKYVTRNLWKPKRHIIVPTHEMKAALRDGYTPEEVFAMRRESPPKHGDMSWKRNSIQRTRLSADEDHSHDRCPRCHQSPETNISPFAHGYLDTRIKPVLSDFGTVLVIALNTHGSQKPDACVFGLRPIDEFNGDAALSVMIEDLMQANLVYHTLKCGATQIPPNDGIKQNFPLPYRRPRPCEKVLISRWIEELRNEMLQDKPDIPKHHYDTFLFYLSIGHLECDALALEPKPRKDGLWTASALVEGHNHRGFISPMNANRKLSLAWGLVVPRFTTWASGRNYLREKYPKQYELFPQRNVSRRPADPSEIIEID